MGTRHGDGEGCRGSPLSWGQNLAVQPAPSPLAAGCAHPGTAHMPALRTPHHGHGQGTTVTPQGGKSRAAGTGRGTGSRAGAGEDPQRGPHGPLEGQQPMDRARQPRAWRGLGEPRAGRAVAGTRPPRIAGGALAQPWPPLTIKTLLEAPARHRDGTSLVSPSGGSWRPRPYISLGTNGGRPPQRVGGSSPCPAP